MDTKQILLGLGAAGAGALVYVAYTNRVKIKTYVENNSDLIGLGLVAGAVAIPILGIMKSIPTMSTAN
jgi:hypothetical protein